MKKWIFLLLLTSLFATEAPLLTGPLLAPVGQVVPYGDFLIKSYLYTTANTGAYNKNWEEIPAWKNFYSINAQFPCFFGLTPWCDLNIIPQFFYETISSQHYSNIGDLTVGLDIQLLDAKATPYFPGIKFAVREIFPTGNFQNFHPRKLKTEQTGTGTFATQFDLVFYKVFHLHGVHWLSATGSAQYTVNTPVHVHGFNTYGGGFGTRGTVLPGNEFQAIASIELTLSKHWALALDTVYIHTEADEFHGTRSFDFSGGFAQVSRPAFEELSFAPAIEYNFNSHFGIIGGCWISALGRNCAEFRSGVINFVYFY
jgi:hypothetical protein